MCVLRFTQSPFDLLILCIGNITVGGVDVVDGRIKNGAEVIVYVFGIDLSGKNSEYLEDPIGPGAFFLQQVRQCCNDTNRLFFDECMPDGSIVHSMARRIGRNPITGTVATAIVVLSITGADDSVGLAGIKLKINQD